MAKLINYAIIQTINRDSEGYIHSDPISRRYKIWSFLKVSDYQTKGINTKLSVDNLEQNIFSFECFQNIILDKINDTKVIINSIDYRIIGFEPYHGITGGLYYLLEGANF